jgi:hypothetical protein
VVTLIASVLSSFDDGKYKYNNNNNNNACWILCFLSVLLNSTTAWDARSLLDQVPIKTEIVPGIVAPHREAFQRTMSMMHYCNLRILGKLFHLEETPEEESIYYYYYYYYYYAYVVMLWSFGWYSFLPLSSKFQNLNTWIFVVPMFLGVTTDMLQMIVNNRKHHHAAGAAAAAVVDIQHYLVIELSALFIAFWFTLAFRGYMSVAQVYLGSAIMVAGLFGGGLYVVFLS